MALSGAIPGSVYLHLECDVAGAWQTETFLGFFRSGQSYEEKGVGLRDLDRQEMTDG
jgi:hypothetical protein